MGIKGDKKKKDNQDVPSEDINFGELIDELDASEAKAKADARVAAEKEAEERRQVALREAKVREEAQERANAYVEEGDSDKAKASGIGRFTLLVEENQQIVGDKDMVSVAGTIHGSVKKGSTVYAYTPTGRVYVGKLDSMEHLTADGLVTIDVAADMEISLNITGIKSANDVPKFSVITNIMPQTTVKAEKNVENPYLLGISYGYQKYFRELDYFNLLINEVVHSFYLTEMRLSKEPSKSDDGKFRIEKNTTIGFPMLNHPKDKDKKILPVFTDWAAFGRHKFNLDDDKKPRCLILDFPDCASISTKDCDGFVINPFGPFPIYISSKLIGQITASPAYKEYISTRTEHSVVTKLNSDDKASNAKPPRGMSKLVLGVPQLTDEVRAIRKAIADFCAGETSVKAANLFMRKGNLGEVSYLGIIDCPQEDAARIFKSLTDKTSKLAHEIRIIDFKRYNNEAVCTGPVGEATSVYKK